MEGARVISESLRGFTISRSLIGEIYQLRTYPQLYSLNRTDISSNDYLPGTNDDILNV